jgi:excisionase family DNA binding protein
MSASETARLMTVPEVAKRLNISRSKTYQLIDSGALPHFRIGGSVRVAEDQLAEFLESVRQGPPERAAPTRRTRSTLKHLRA